MSNKDGSQRLFEIKSRRLQILKEQKAFRGEDADPRISMEIEDLENEIKELRMETNPISQNSTSQAQAKSTENFIERPGNPPVSPTSEPEKNIQGGIINPWKSGSFYLFSFILGFLAYLLLRTFNGSGYDVVAAFGVGIAIMLVVGALQLRNDERLSETSFIALVTELFKRFPFFRKSKDD